MGNSNVVITAHVTVKIILNSGRVIEVEDVFNPGEVLKLMMESYLKR